MNEFAALDAFESRIGSLIAALEPAARRDLASSIGRKLIDSQSQRIGAQQNPDGSPFAPRKPQGKLRGKAGFVRRRAMFSRLRTRRWMRVETSPEAAAVTFINSVQRMAQVHQHGLRDRVNKHGLEADYPARALLGFSAADLAMIDDEIVAHLAAGRV